jgi:hypothetical protein
MKCLVLIIIFFIYSFTQTQIIVRPYLVAPNINFDLTANSSLSKGIELGARYNYESFAFELAYGV